MFSNPQKGFQPTAKGMGDPNVILCKNLWPKNKIPLGFLKKAHTWGNNGETLPKEEDLSRIFPENQGLGRLTKVSNGN